MYNNFLVNGPGSHGDHVGRNKRSIPGSAYAGNGLRPYPGLPFLGKPPGNCYASLSRCKTLLALRAFRFFIFSKDTAGEVKTEISGNGAQKETQNEPLYLLQIYKMLL